MGTWKQNGAVTALATNTSQAIKLAGMGVWEQRGPVNISLAQRAIGTFLERRNAADVSEDANGEAQAEGDVAPLEHTSC